MAVLKTVAQFKDSVAGILSGIDLSNVDNLNGALERAARTLVQQADIPEACLTQNIVLYNGVYDYACDTRIFGTAINDIRPQGVSRQVSDYVYKQYGDDFDRTKGYVRLGTRATFEYESGVPIIRIVSDIPTQKVELDPMTSTTGWTAAGSATGLTADSTVFYQSPASLRFTLTGSSTGTLTKTLSSIDLSSYQGVGVVFLAIFIPDGVTASALTSIDFYLSSDNFNANFDQVSATEGFLGSWIAGEWLLVAFDLSTATTSGPIDYSAIDAVKIELNHTSTFTNFRVGGLWVSLPSPAQILCQTAAIFKAGTAATTETITTDDDVIILNNPAYTLFEWEGALSILQQTGATESSAAVVDIKNRLHGTPQDIGLYKLFRGDNPSQELRQVGSYYEVNDPYQNG